MKLSAHQNNKQKNLGRSMKRVSTRKYGVISKPDHLLNDESILEQLKLQNRLWNTLVEIDHYDREQYNSLISSHPEVNELEKEIDDMNKALVGLKDQKSSLNQSSRDKQSGKHLNDEIRQVTKDRKPLYASLKKAKLKARKAFKEELAGIGSEHYELTKRARQCSGLWWCNYEFVIKNYEVARSKAMKEGATLRFKRFDKTGTLSFRVQKGLSVAEVFSGTKRFSINPLPVHAYMHELKSEQRKAQKVDFQFPINANKDNNLTARVWMHRPLEEGARFKYARMTFKKINGKYRCHLVITSTIENAKPVISKSPLVCGINFGFRKEPTGSVRIATLYGEDGSIEKHELDYAFLSKMSELEDKQSYIDLKVNELLPLLVASVPDELSEWASYITRRVARKKTGITQILKLLDELRVKYDIWEFEPERKHLKSTYLAMSCARTRLLNRRRNEYRRIAKQIVDKFGVIGFDSTSYKELSRTKTTDIGESELPRAVRKQRKDVAISELRESILSAAMREGCDVRDVLFDFTKTCSHCGSKSVDMSNVASSPIATCKTCNTIHDIDENAAKNITAHCLNDDDNQCVA